MKRQYFTALFYYHPTNLSPHRLLSLYHLIPLSLYRIITFIFFSFHFIDKLK
ncbi:hypothetical protein BACEGG_03160 [Bacteroides eggerthii DSM 20697]|nr:hypothetical protein BACEGG_03160 [Bacteroides eggerthii DSM 20697]